jgi:hypothetical protein
MLVAKKKETWHRWFKVKEVASLVFYNYEFEIHWFQKVWFFLESNLSKKKSGEFLKELEEPNNDIPTEVYLWILGSYSGYFSFKATVELEAFSNYPSFTEYFSPEEVYKESLDDMTYNQRLSEDIIKYQNALYKMIKKKYLQEFQLIDFFTNLDFVLSEEDFKLVYLALHQSRIIGLEDYFNLEVQYEEYKSRIAIHNLGSVHIMEAITFVLSI